MKIRVGDKADKRATVALGVQLGVVDLVVVLVGAGVLTIPDMVVNTFIVSVFGEIVGLSLIVARYLFPKLGDEVKSLIEKL